MAYVRKHLRVDEELFTDIQKIAQELNTNDNQAIILALKHYRDHYYMQNKASILNEQILGIIQGSLKVCENNINNKTNKVLSELAIQTAVQNMIMAHGLEISQSQLHTFRLRALDFLKENNRVLRLDEVVDG